jgi:hypothetical protein
MADREEVKEGQVPEGYDLILEMLINMAKLGHPVPITVHSGGVIITGVLITETEYLKAFAGGKIFEAMKRKVEGDEKLMEMAEQANDDPTEHDFIHIKNAKFILSNGRMIPNEGHLMWRGRKDAIDGYLPAQLASA